jgi:hypothetical protein
MAFRKFQAMIEATSVEQPLVNAQAQTHFLHL